MNSRLARVQSSIAVLHAIRDAAPCVRCECTPKDPLPELQEVGAMKIPQPSIGAWYRNPGGVFEVVASDEDDGTIEIQYFDGTIEELEREDWDAQWKAGSLETAEAPEDWSGSVDVESPEEDAGSDSGFGERDLRASPIKGIDRFS
jgi:hypothetical protein